MRITLHPLGSPCLGTQRSPFRWSFNFWLSVHISLGRNLRKLFSTSVRDFGEALKLQGSNGVVQPLFPTTLPSVECDPDDYLCEKPLILHVNFKSFYEGYHGYNEKKGALRVVQHRSVRFHTSQRRTRLIRQTSDRYNHWFCEYTVPPSALSDC